MDQCHEALAASNRSKLRLAQGAGVTDIVRRKLLSFEEYWLASKAWEGKGLQLGTARALVNAGFLSVEDLHSAHDLELATIPRVGRKSLAILYGLMGRAMPGAPQSQMTVSGRERRQPKPVLQM
jgi:Helix-hairpin-helix domain